jgi:hypothetical protein
MRVQDVMKQIQRVVHTIAAQGTVEDAIVRMTERRTSAMWPGAGVCFGKCP